jgi:hypothetical protein
VGDAAHVLSEFRRHNSINLHAMFAFSSFYKCVGVLPLQFNNHLESWELCYIVHFVHLRKPFPPISDKVIFVVSI